MLKCPVCYSEDINKKILRHHEFKNNWWHECNTCNHIFTCFKEVYKSDKSFTTNKERANNYINYFKKELVGKCNSIIEIGSANDFYFLKEIHKLDKNIKLFVNDSFDYSNDKRLPEFITFIKNLEDIKKTEICYMSHSLEHIPDIDNFLNILSNKIKTFLIEIPISVNTEWLIKRRIRTKQSGWHYHYYTKNSLIKKFNQFDYQYKNIDVETHENCYNFIFEKNK